jgi:hypothetical protein
LHHKPKETRKFIFNWEDTTMKRILTLLAIATFASCSIFAQDDMYFTPKSKAVKDKEKAEAKAQRAAQEKGQAEQKQAEQKQVEQKQAEPVSAEAVADSMAK